MNFQYWCATRVLTPDRKYAKVLLNSIGASQATTDRDRAKVALSYHCLTLTDLYWVRQQGEEVQFSGINLYENQLSNAFVDISLRGREMTVENAHLIADDMSTSGVFPKAWIRRDGTFYLYKDEDERAVEDEILASRIARCFKVPQVLYEEELFEGKKISVCKLFTNQRYSIATREAFEIYAVNHEMDPDAFIQSLDVYGWYMMNLIDYLVGNTDRHWGNWGFLIDNQTHRPVRLHELMDFNQAFHSYDRLEGAGCQTMPGRGWSQQEAAAAAVREVGFNQIAEPQKRWFKGREEEYEMFRRRLEVLSKS